MKRHSMFIDNHGNWVGDQTLTSYENSDGEWVKYSDVEALVAKLKEYLSHDSIDGKKIRQQLRKELKEMIGEQT